MATKSSNSKTPIRKSTNTKKNSNNNNTTLKQTQTQQKQTKHKGRNKKQSPQEQTNNKHMTTKNNNNNKHKHTKTNTIKHPRNKTVLSVGKHVHHLAPLFNTWQACAVSAGLYLMFFYEQKQTKKCIGNNRRRTNITK